MPFWLAFSSLISCLLDLGAGRGNQPTAALSSDFSQSLSKMVIGQLPSPGGHLHLNNSLASAVWCIHCSSPLVNFSVEVSVITSSHCASAGSSCPSQAISWGSVRKHPFPPLCSTLWSLSSLSQWSLSLASDPY